MGGQYQKYGLGLSCRHSDLFGERLDSLQDELLPPGLRELAQIAIEAIDELLKSLDVCFLSSRNLPSYLLQRDSFKSRSHRRARALRAVAIGRKNYLFAGSDAGGERAAPCTV